MWLLSYGKLWQILCYVYGEDIWFVIMMVFIAHANLLIIVYINMLHYSSDIDCIFKLVRDCFCTDSSSGTWMAWPSNCVSVCPVRTPMLMPTSPPAHDRRTSWRALTQVWAPSRPVLPWLARGRSSLTSADSCSTLGRSALTLASDTMGPRLRTTRPRMPWTLVPFRATTQASPRRAQTASAATGRWHLVLHRIWPPKILLDCHLLVSWCSLVLTLYQNFWEYLASIFSGRIRCVCEGCGGRCEFCEDKYHRYLLTYRRATQHMQMSVFLWFLCFCVKWLFIALKKAFLGKESHIILLCPIVRHPFWTLWMF